MNNFFKLTIALLSVLLLTACATNSNEDLICKTKFANNDEQTFKYLFKDGKAYSIKITILIPKKQIADPNKYEKEFNKINEIKGCNGTFENKNDEMYQTIQTCDLTKMTDAEIMSVYSVSRDKLEQTRTELLNLYENSDTQTTCK